MSASVKAVLGISFTVTETVDTAADPFATTNSTDNKKPRKAGGADIVLTGSTTPAVTKVSSFKAVLSSGALTLDLTNLPDGVNATGLKIRACYFQSITGNANPISIASGASNGYLLFGTGGKETLSPGEDMCKRLKDALSAVDSTHKNIDLAGTGAQELDVMLVLG